MDHTGTGKADRREKNVLMKKIRSGMDVLAELGIMELLAYAPEYLGELVRHKRDKFDGRYGTDTNTSVSVGALDVAAPAKSGAELYWPVRADSFSSIMEHLDIAPDRMTFIDCGSGKGRALMLAAEHGFRQSIGVEFSPELCRISQDNAKLFKAARPQAPPIETHCMDARSFDFPEGPLCIFLFDPFGPEILAPVLDRLLESLKDSPRQVRLAYYLPMHRDVVLDKGFSCMARRERNWRAQYPWMLFKGPCG